MTIWRIPYTRKPMGSLHFGGGHDAGRACERRGVRREKSEERRARNDERGASARRSRSIRTASFQIRGKRHIRSPRCTLYTSYTTWATRLSAASPCFYSWSAPVPCNIRRPVSPCRCTASTGRPRRPLQPRLRRPRCRRRRVRVRRLALLPRMDPHVASRPSAAPAAACSARPRAGRTASSLRGSRHPSRWALRDTSVVLGLGSFPACS